MPSAGILVQPWEGKRQRYPLGIQLLYTGMQGRCITSPGKGINNSLVVLEDSRSKILPEPRYLCNLEKFLIIRQILPSPRHFE